MSPFSLAASAAPSLREFQIRASLLLKDIRSDDPFRQRAAAERLRRIPLFSSLTADQLVARAGEVRRKHALAAVAAEQGYPSWVALKAAMDAPRVPVLDTTLLFRGGGGGFLNHWFARYDDARACLESVGGFLFPHGTQFFVCPAGLLEAKGIDPEDADWSRIGHDWVRPADTTARARLTEVMVELGYAA